MAALVALICCSAAVALSLVARDVVIRALEDRADARARAVQTDEAWRAEIDERVREMSKRVNEHHAALASPRRVRA